MLSDYYRKKEHVREANNRHRIFRSMPKKTLRWNNFKRKVFKQASQTLNNPLEPTCETLVFHINASQHENPAGGTIFIFGFFWTIFWIYFV